MKNTRVKNNHNLTEWTDPYFYGMPVCFKKGCLVTEYLEKLKLVIENAMEDCSRILAVRVDLRCAEVTADLADSNKVMERFKKAIDSRINSYLERKRREGERAHPAKLRMVWAREENQSPTPHYHILLLFNRDLFYRLGDYQTSAGSLATMISGAWYSALGISSFQRPGLVHFPKNPQYYLNRNSDTSQLKYLFYRASYLCKVNTKCMGRGFHSFGASRR